MKWTWILMAMLLGTLTLTVRAEVAPQEKVVTDEQILQAAKSPITITNLLQNVSNEQAGAIIEKVIAQVDLLDITLGEKKARVAFLLGLVQRTLGEQAGPVLRNVMPPINPALAPTVALGAPPIGMLGLPTALPLAPPVAPRYPGQ